VVSNIGHTPDTGPCGVAMALDFIRHLHTDVNRCRHDGRPPVVIGRPPLRAAQLSGLPVHASAPMRRAVGVALATLSDERMAAATSGLTGTLDALRGGTYEVGDGEVRFAGAHVVRDAVVDGTLQGARARLRVRGRGVPGSQLTLDIGRRATRVTGSIGGRHVALRVPVSRRA
jgi:hypothetical protein